MNTLFRNKLLTGLVILLLIANIATIVMFWMGMRKDHPRPHQQAQEYIINHTLFSFPVEEVPHHPVADQLVHDLDAFPLVAGQPSFSIYL